ncbi:MAG TPA: hypothetical protein VN688_18670 [Gemmataceae bacterium]|nr:hypothetical protein [Gemmataceae bacterium]
MRALSGAIITAAALIGLGLTAQGIGTRYSEFIIRKPVTGEQASQRLNEPDFEKSEIKIRDLDNPMKLCLTILVLATLVGLGITFVGLAYHHHRRYHEQLRTQASGIPSTHTHTPM